jgi:hypothetical protein
VDTDIVGFSILGIGDSECLMIAQDVVREVQGSLCSWGRTREHPTCHEAIQSLGALHNQKSRVQHVAGIEATARHCILGRFTIEKIGL